MTHTVKSLKALLREYKHLHSFAYSKMKKHELYAIALKLGLINEDSLNVKKVKKEKVKRIKKVKNDKVDVDNDREKLKQNINNLIISEQLKHETKKKELKSIMDKYDYETKKIDRALIKKDIVIDENQIIKNITSHLVDPDERYHDYADIDIMNNSRSMLSNCLIDGKTQLTKNQIDNYKYRYNQKYQ